MLTVSMAFALQLHVVNPKRYAVPRYGDELPPFNPNDTINVTGPIWDLSLQCLWDDHKDGGRVLAEAFGHAWGGHVTNIEGAIIFGGWKDSSCPVLVIFLHRTVLDHGSAISLLNIDTARAFAIWLLNATRADSVVASNWGTHIQVEVQAVAYRTLGGN